MNSKNNPKGIKALFLDKALIRGKKSIATNGAERFNLHLLSQLQQHGIELTVFASNTWATDIKNISDRGLLHHVTLPQLSRVAWPNTLLSNFILNREQETYDLLIVGNVGRNLLPLVKRQYSKQRFKKIVLMAHREPTKMFLKMLSPLQPTIVAVNDKIAQGFIDAGFEDTHVYFGEIDSEAFAPSKTKRKPADNQFNFCVFGSLDSQLKGSDTAVKAFGNLPEKIRSNSRLNLAGFAKDPPKFEDSKIVPYPWIEQKEIPEFLRSMDVVLIPSRDTNIMKETFSQASVQAMLTGLPLLVSNLPILEEKVSNGGGLIFKDDQELTKHMQLLFENSELREKLRILRYRPSGLPLGY